MWATPRKYDLRRRRHRSDYCQCSTAPQHDVDFGDQKSAPMHRCSSAAERRTRWCRGFGCAEARWIESFGMRKASGFLVKVGNAHEHRAVLPRNPPRAEWSKLALWTQLFDYIDDAAHRSTSKIVARRKSLPFVEFLRTSSASTSNSRVSLETSSQNCGGGSVARAHRGSTVRQTGLAVESSSHVARCAAGMPGRPTSRRDLIGAGPCRSA